MKAVICKKYGPPEVLEVVDIPRPIPTKNQVLVKIGATTVNSGDVRLRALRVGEGFVWGVIKLIIRCLVGFRGPRKKILGMVFAGEVVEAGEAVSSFKVGDRVYGMTGLQMGTFAEFTAVAETQSITHMPTSASFAEAAALPFGGTTALYFLRKAGIEKAKQVLIYGSSGAVGTAAVQVAKYYGAEVTAVCGEDGIELAKELGADTVYNYKTQPVKDIRGQFDVIFDAVGKVTKTDVAHLLAPEARFVTVGGFDTAKETVADLAQLVAMYDEGSFRAVIDRTYDLTDMVAAHRYVDAGSKKGNVVVTVG